MPDPIKVVMPPKTAAKLRGIITRDAVTPYRSAKACMMGIKMTTTGMLFKKALLMINR